jgi:hypothetical protein
MESEDDNYDEFHTGPQTNKALNELLANSRKNSAIIKNTKLIVERTYQTVVDKLASEERFVRYDEVSKAKAGPTALIWTDSIGFVESLLFETREFLSDQEPSVHLGVEFFESQMACELLQLLEALFNFDNREISLREEYRIDAEEQSKKGRVKGRPWGTYMFLVGTINKMLWQCLSIHSLRQSKDEQSELVEWFSVYTRRFERKDQIQGRDRSDLMLAHLPMVRPFIEFVHQLTGMKERAILVYLDTYRLATEFGPFINSVLTKYFPDMAERNLAITRLHDYPTASNNKTPIYREKSAFELILKSWQEKKFENKDMPGAVLARVFEENFMVSADSTKEIEARLRSLQANLGSEISTDSLLYKEAVQSWLSKVLKGLGDLLIAYEIPPHQAQKFQVGGLPASNTQHLIAVYKGYPFRQKPSEGANQTNVTSLHICVHHAAGIYNQMGSLAKAEANKLGSSLDNLSRKFQAAAAGNLFNVLGTLSTPLEAHATLLLTHGIEALRFSGQVISHFYSLDNRLLSALDPPPYPIFAIAGSNKESVVIERIKREAMFNIWNKDADLSKPLTMLSPYGHVEKGSILLTKDVSDESGNGDS